MFRRNRFYLNSILRKRNKLQVYVNRHLLLEELCTSCEYIKRLVPVFDIPQNEFSQTTKKRINLKEEPMYTSKSL